MNSQFHRRQLPWHTIGSAFGLPEQLDRQAPIVTQGFSGTELWKVRTADIDYIVRRQPETASKTRLTEIQRVVQHVAAHGCPFVPVPRLTKKGNCWLALGSRLWQLEPAMRGNADYLLHPSPPRLQNAMTALARWHLAAATLTGNNNIGPAPGITARLARTRQIKAEHILERLLPFAKTTGSGIARFARFVERFVSEFSQQEPELGQLLAAASQQEVPIQYCIRDIHHEHVLFADPQSDQADQVTGIIDYDAVRTDCVAADLSRLLRSLLSGGSDEWREAIQAYEQLRPLSEAEHSLLAVYDRANRVLSGISWLDWIFLQGRHFDENRVEQRLDTLLQAL